MSSSSLRDFDCIADRIKLARQLDQRSVLVVEGKSDRRVALRVLPAPSPEFYIAGTRQVVLDAATDVVRLQIERVACVVDRDFDDVVSAREGQGEPLAVYDNADLEAMLWYSSTLEEMIDEIGSHEKLVKFGGLAALRARVAEVLRPLTRLRRANAINAWGIDFDGLDLASKVDLRTLSIQSQALCDALWSDELGVPKRDLYAAADGAEEPRCCPHSGTELLRGRDALAVAGVALRRLVGSLNHQSSSVDRIEESLRLAARSETVQETRWIELVTTLLA